MQRDCEMGSQIFTICVSPIERWATVVTLYSAGIPAPIHYRSNQAVAISPEYFDTMVRLDKIQRLEYRVKCWIDRYGYARLRDCKIGIFESMSGQYTHHR